MPRYLKSIRLRILFFTISIFLVGCNQMPQGQNITVTPDLKKSPAGKLLTPTQFSTPQIDSTFLPSTFIPQMEVTLTPDKEHVITLVPKIAQEQKERLLETNDNCTGTCFWGIYPGLTSFEEGLRLLRTLGSRGLLSDNGGNGDKRYDDEFQIKDGKIDIQLTLFETKGIIKKLNASADGLSTLGVSGKDWLAFRPDNYIKAHGVPNQVQIFMGENVGPGNYFEYSIVLIYDNGYFGFSGEQSLKPPEHIMHVCPLKDNNINVISVGVGEYDRGELNGMGIVDLTQMTHTTMESVYKTLTGDPQKSCIDLDYSIFLSHI